MTWRRGFIILIAARTEASCCVNLALLSAACGLFKGLHDSVAAPRIGRQKGTGAGPGAGTGQPGHAASCT